MLETVFPFALVPVPVLPRVHTIAFNLAILPLTYIVVALKPLPDAEAVLHPSNPLSIIDFPIPPSVNALALRFILYKLPYVLATIRIQLKASPVPLFILPFPLENSAVRVDQHAKALPLPFLQTAFIETIFVTFDSEVLLFG